MVARRSSRAALGALAGTAAAWPAAAPGSPRAAKPSGGMIASRASSTRAGGISGSARAQASATSPSRRACWPQAAETAISGTGGCSNSSKRGLSSCDSASIEARTTAQARRNRSASCCWAQPRRASSANAASCTVITWPWVASKASTWSRSSVKAGFLSQRSRALSSTAVRALRSMPVASAESPSVGQVPAGTTSSSPR